MCSIGDVLGKPYELDDEETFWFVINKFHEEQKKNNSKYSNSFKFFSSSAPIIQRLDVALVKVWCRSMKCCVFSKPSRPSPSLLQALNISSLFNLNIPKHPYRDARIVSIFLALPVLFSIPVTPLVPFFILFSFTCNDLLSPVFLYLNHSRTWAVSSYHSTSFYNKYVLFAFFLLLSCNYNVYIYHDTHNDLEPDIPLVPLASQNPFHSAIRTP